MSHLCVLQDLSRVLRRVLSKVIGTSYNADVHDWGMLPNATAHENLRDPVALAWGLEIYNEAFTLGRYKEQGKRPYETKKPLLKHNAEGPTG